MSEIIGFLTAGAFVYLALKVKLAFGDGSYYLLVLLALLVGSILSHIKGV